MPEAYRDGPSPPDRPARPLGDHRHAARGQLDQPGGPPLRRKAILMAKVSGRGRTRGLPLFCGGGRSEVRSRRAVRAVAFRASEVLLDLQLPDPDLGPTWGAIGWLRRMAPRSSTRCRSPVAPTVPYARAMVRICQKRSPSTSARGLSEILNTLSHGDRRAGAGEMAQDAIRPLGGGLR